MNDKKKSIIEGYTNDDILRYLLDDMNWEEAQAFKQKLATSDALQQQVAFLETGLTAAVQHIAIPDLSQTSAAYNPAVQHTIDTVFNQPLSVSDFLHLAWQGFALKVIVGVLVLAVAVYFLLLTPTPPNTVSGPNILNVRQINGIQLDTLEKAIKANSLYDIKNILIKNNPKMKGDIFATELLIALKERKSLPSEDEFKQKVEEIRATDSEYTTPAELLVIQIGYYQWANKPEKIKVYCEELLNTENIKDNEQYKTEAQRILAELKSSI